MRIAVLHSDKENWKSAIKYFKIALDKGGLKRDLGRAHMNLGIALFNAGKSTEALASLKKAQKYKATKRNASQWINYVRDAISKKS